MALRFAGASLARLADAENLPAGSCAWIAWDSRSGGPPGEAYVDVNAVGRPAPNPASLRASLADAKRFYLFPTRIIGGEALASYRGEWIPRASNEAAGPASKRTTAAGTQPIIRQLMCRGGPSGFEFRVIANPSPAHPQSPRYVRLAIRYRANVASDTAELALGRMSPGSCGWDMRFGAPEPPGEVIIDIQTDAQASNASLGIPRDTSAPAVLAYPDTASLRRYLSEPSHFWTFYQLDRGEPLASSHGAYKPDLTRLLAGSVQDARTTASGTRTSGYTAVEGSLRDGATSAARAGAEPSSTHAVRQAPVTVSRTPATTSVIPSPAPTPGSSIAGPLRGTAPPAATSPAERALPTDTAGKRSATERTPTPTSSVEGTLRDGPSGKDTLAGTRALPSPDKPSDNARTSIPQVRRTRVYNVRTAPGPRGVKITFDATGISARDGNVLGGFLLPGDPMLSIRVHFSRTRPTWSERERTWSFPAGSNRVWDTKISRREGGGYDAVPSNALEAGKRYFYLITVYSSDESSPPAQRTGSFTADIRHPLGEVFSH
ncbi:MAG TPA: hypothetical protein VFK36_03670 [Gemmatimonadales bacterium]|nr:hypothetical protein [Gemmatimonadales bacterium]